MVFPTVTAVYAALLGLVFLALSGWVSAGRVRKDVLVGNGDDDLTRRVRSHANFTEYVPFVLLLLALLEAAGASHTLIGVLGFVLLVARVLHPVGMLAPKNSPQQFVCRGGGIIATYIVLLIAAVALLIKVA